MAAKFYITTPIYYINASPHIGHSYTTIAADTIARYMRARIGKDRVWFLTGTDEHGQKIQKAADEKGLSPQDFADLTVTQFKGLWEKLGISYNDFIRTTEERHTKVVQEVLEILYRKGDIYQDTYEGWYCTPCETFWLESQLVEGNCPDCGRKVEKLAETNYFFRLSHYQDWLIRHIEAHPRFIQPQIRHNEVLSFLKNNTLTDLCISRPRERLSWGIPLPFSPAHVTYVWFDALINYISAVGSFDAAGRYRSAWWPADIHFIGKDILRQHAVYWPAMLRALDIEPAQCVFAHGWWMMGESKMSKSRGNVIAPLEMVDKFGIDVYRYFLLRDVPFGMDGTFSEDAIIKRFNGDLANDLGNLVYRTLTMVEKYYSGRVPAVKSFAQERARAIAKKIEGLDAGIDSALGPGSGCDFIAALGAIWEIIGMANKYVEEAKPWNIAKDAARAAELEEFIFCLVHAIRSAAAALAPFMPATAASIHRQLGGDIIAKGEPLFPRIDTRSAGA